MLNKVLSWFSPKFTGLFDSYGEPLFEGDEYLILKEINGRLHPLGDGKRPIPKTVEYVVSKDRAGYSIPTTDWGGKIKKII